MISYNVTSFFIAGFTFDSPTRECVIITLILIYCLTLMGNILIITATSIDQNLQTPMYFFLRCLATLDILAISSTVPKLLSILVSLDKTISLDGCLLQLYFYVSAGGTEFYILGVLSIDRYIAICYPLRYCTIMTKKVCWKIIFCIWIFGFLESIPAILLMSRLHWCSGNNVINHFFCDGSEVLHLSCSDTHLIEIMFFCCACFSILSSLVPTVCSYCFIISSILRLSSSTGKRKTFSTCSSHFIAVLITYGSCIFIYVRPAGTTTSGNGKTVAVFNSILTPFLHPFIYSLRNQMVVTSLKRMIKVNYSFN